MASKAWRILDLLEHTDLSNKEMAAAVGCNEAYVRVVQQRLVHGGATPSERAWKARRRLQVLGDETLLAKRRETHRLYMRGYYHRKLSVAARSGARS